jgi:hypothetical protein
MAKSMKNTVRAAAKIAKERELLVKQAIDDGNTTRSTIVKATGLGKNVVTNMLSTNEELRTMWLVKKRMMVGTAIDNIDDILNDPKNPKNFEASTWVASNIDADGLGELFTSPANIELQIPGTDTSNSDEAVVIKFTSKRDND